MFVLEVLSHSPLTFSTAAEKELFTDPNIYTEITGVRPKIASDNEGTLYMVWRYDVSLGISDIYLSKSTDDGYTWTNPIKVNKPSNIRCLDPSLAVDSENIYVTWADNRSGNFNIYFTWACRNDTIFSNDDLKVNSDITEQNQYTPAIAVDRVNIYVVWHDYRNYDPETDNKRYNSDIYLDFCSRDSIDFSGEDIKITDDTGWYKGHPSVATDGEYIYVSWEDKRCGSRYHPDIYFDFSPVSNINFTQPDVKVNSNLENTTEDSYSSIAADNRNVYIAWHSYNYSSGKWSIYFDYTPRCYINFTEDIKISLDNTTFAHYPAVTCCGTYVFIVWEEMRIDKYEIYFDKSPIFNIDFSAEDVKVNDNNSTGAASPAITAYKNENIMHACVVWEDGRTPGGIYFARTAISNNLPICNIYYPSSGSIISEVITISGSASDPDGDPQLVCIEVKIDNGTWDFLTGTPMWNYTWDTTAVENGWHTIYARSYDGINYSFEASVSVYVDNQLANNRPIITYYYPKVDRVINETDSITFNITATDPDDNNLFYSWYINDTLLIGEINDSYIFTTNYDSSGVYEIKVVVTDSGFPPLSVNHSWNLTVLNKNRKPVLETIDDQTAYEGQLFTLQVNASDPDNDSLTFSDNSTLFDINITTGFISFTPNYDSSGTYSINITVSDGIDVDYRIFTLTIVDVNRKPTATISLPQDNAKFTTTDDIYFDATGSSDPDNDNLIYTWASSIDGNIENTVSFSRKLSKGTHTITLTVSDGTAEDYKQITITVEKPVSQQGEGFIPGFEVASFLLALIGVCVLLLRRRKGL